MKFIKELTTYDQIIDLKRDHEIESQEIDKIKDYKTWQLKTDISNKRFLKRMNDLTKQKDSYALKGDLNANSLYHYTDLESCHNIIVDNQMISGEDGISFTTNPNLYKRGFVFWYPNKYSEGKHDKNTPVKMKFNFNKMKTDGLKFKTGSENLGTYAGEEEIRFIDYEINNCIKYIQEVIIIKEKTKNPSYLSKVIEALDENNIKYKVV